MKKVLALLKTLFAHKGLSDATINKVAEYLSKNVTDASTDTEIETIVKGVEPILSAFQSEADGARTKAVQTQRAFDDYKLANPAKQADPPPAPPPGGNSPEMAQMLKMMEAFNKRFADMDAKAAAETIQTKFANLCKTEKIPDSLVKLATREFKDEAEMMASFENLKAANAEVVQKQADDKFKAPEIVGGFKSQKEAEDPTKVSPLMQGFLAEKAPKKEQK